MGPKISSRHDACHVYRPVFFMCPWPPGIRGNGTVLYRAVYIDYSGTDVLSPRRHVYNCHILDVCTWHHDGHVPLEIKSEKIRAKAKKATTQYTNSIAKNRTSRCTSRCM